MGTGEIGIVKNHFNTVIIIYMSIFNISFPVNLQPADKSSKLSNMKSDFTSTAKDSSPKETIAYICGLRARIECEPISEHSTRRDRVTNIGYRLFGGASPCELKQHFFHFYMCWKYRFHFYFFSLFMLRTKILDSISKMCFNKI
jgi:hypothetical protein